MSYTNILTDDFYKKCGDCKSSAHSTFREKQRIILKYKNDSKKKETEKIMFIYRYSILTFNIILIGKAVHIKPNGVTAKAVHIKTIGLTAKAVHIKANVVTAKAVHIKANAVTAKAVHIKTIGMTAKAVHIKIGINEA
jgi:acetyltransferase-like isoleucine patch superfamily enzyme